MSIDWLYDLERDLDNGKEIFGTPGLGRNQWVIGKPIDELKPVAQRTANHRKLAVNIVRLIPKNEAIAGDLFLVPVQIGEPGNRGEPQVQWSTVETKEAAEMMRDVRQGSSPFFGMQVEQAINPDNLED